MENQKDFSSDYFLEKKLKLPTITITNPMKKTMKSYLKIRSALPP